MIPFLPGNDLVSGGAVLIVLGAALSYFRNIPGNIYNLLERFFIIRLDFQEEDESFAWLKLWLSEKLRGTLSISVLSRRPEYAPDFCEPQDYLKYSVEDATSADRRPRVIFTPAPGWYCFIYKNRFVTINRHRTEPEGKGGNEGGITKPRESFTMRIFSRNLAIAKNLVEEARDYTLPKDGKLEVRTCGHGHYWNLNGRIRPRPIESVILDGTIAEDLIADIKTFQKSGDWYNKLGVPYRRTYLFYGAPGGGKTSMAIGIASALNMNINILNLSTPGLTDGKIIELLAAVDVNTLVVIEDVDCSFVQRKTGPDRKGKIDLGLTFSGVLNALDGILANDGRIIIMTTNHPELLDEALMREGRTDVKVHIGLATHSQMIRLFRRFFPEHVNLAEDFAAQLPPNKIKVAKLQHHFIKYRNDAVNAVKNASEIMAKEVYEHSSSDQSKRTTGQA